MNSTYLSRKIISYIKKELEFQMRHMIQYK